MYCYHNRSRSRVSSQSDDVSLAREEEGAGMKESARNQSLHERYRLFSIIRKWYNDTSIQVSVCNRAFDLLLPENEEGVHAMAGPSFIILLPSPLTEAQIHALDGWLNTFALALETHKNTTGVCDEWFFRVEDAGELGLPGKFRTCMIGLALVEPSREWDGDLEEQMMIRLGFWPRQGINVYAMCKNFPTGRVTSYLILRLMERYEGYLDFCTSERVSQNSRIDTEEHHLESPLPGKGYTIRYWAPDPQHAFSFSCWWEKEVIDKERLRWWLHQDERSILPGFRSAEE